MLARMAVLFALPLFLTACSWKKPFQPPPPEYSEWIKEGVSEESVKQAMKECGYRDLYGYGDRSPADEVARRQNCMFKNGFARRSGYKGLCSLAEQKHLPACIEREKSNSEEN